MHAVLLQRSTKSQNAAPKTRFSKPLVSSYFPRAAMMANFTAKVSPGDAADCESDKLAITQFFPYLRVLILRSCFSLATL